MKKTKPDPEVYLLAVERLGLKPEECLVIEDSLEGVTAARAAGLDVIVLEEAWSEADRDAIRKLATRYVASHDEMLALFES